MIKKYPTIKHSNEPLWELNPGRSYYKKMNEFFKMIEKLSDFKAKRGIQKLESPFIIENGREQKSKTTNQ